VTLPSRITCVISSLGNGGAERVMVGLCGAFVSRGASVTLITLDDGRSDFQRLPRGVERVALGLLGDSRSGFEALRATAGRVMALRRTIRASRPDVVLSFMDRTNVLVLIALRGTDVPVVVAERNNPWMLPIGRMWERLRRFTYGWAAAITVQAEELRAFFGPALASRVVVIPNAVAPVPVVAHMVARETVVLAAGRLEPQKGFDLLIEAFAAASRQFPGWRLRVVGEGAERERLTALCVRLGLHADLVALPGRTSAMADEYRRAGIFVLSSRFEGFPNVLCEAMAHGCPVIATRCRSGPTAIVRDGIDGVLVPVDDVPALAHAMVELMTDAGTRRTLGAAAAALPSRFPEADILNQWAATLRAAAGLGR
jgi:GalNAc-alpha-(1->4)-GalNAc-alpha-(1->3)-diNAcBac-PP-undecaprenol alpha-1,4-N-acetyl-D-galactosaminyltransferase